MWSVLIGAVGAIGAIYLKEAVQAAIQRRVITWQLQGYIVAWRSNLIRQPPIFAFYQKVNERTRSLSAAVIKGEEAFKNEHGQQSQENEELRTKIRAALTEAIEKAEFQKLGDPAWTAYLAEAGASLADHRKLLADAKSFISDRDAAILGKGAAMNVVQFRTSMLYVSFALEALIKILPVRSEHLTQVAATLVDSLVIHVEQALIAMIRLEWGVDRVSRRSLFGLTLDVLQGR